VTTGCCLVLRLPLISSGGGLWGTERSFLLNSGDGEDELGGALIMSPIQCVRNLAEDRLAPAKLSISSKKK
jgi:hypothetical protein